MRIRFFLCCSVLLLLRASAFAAEPCAMMTGWVVPEPAGPRAEAPDRVFARLAQAQAVLLGETHSNPDHHRWQLGVIAGLYALRPSMVLGFEMFPRRIQPVLDQWVAGTITEAEFLSKSEWDRVWGFDASLYMPIFQFARLNRIPMLALNVDRALVQRVSQAGWAAIAATDREGISDPMPASRDYLLWLYPTYREHQAQDPGSAPPEAGSAPSDAQLTDPAFRRFVDGMLLWDRAMAQAIAERRSGSNPPLVVGLIGTGHLRSGYGVPAQLKALGVSNVAEALPWDASACAAIVPGLASALFVVPAHVVAQETPRPRLGIAFEASADGMRVSEVSPKSIAEAAGILVGDVIVQMAGEPVKNAAEMVATVQRQPAGTWLPIVVRRNGATVDLVARFPPRP